MAGCVEFTDLRGKRPGLRRRFARSAGIAGFAVALFVVLVTGCVSKSEAKLRAYKAYIAGQQQKAAEQQRTTVTFVGDVKNHTVDWSEDLTLAKGLLAAEYQALWDPHQILIIRHGETHKINVRAFLNGGDDPHLEPGDVVEIRR